jgi:hypothetical protein
MADLTFHFEEHIEEHGLERRPLIHEAGDQPVEATGISRGGDRRHGEMCLCDSLSHGLLEFRRG